MNLTEENRQNLNQLANYLELLPPDYSHFDMCLYYCGDDDDADYARSPELTCGTVACALGHGPLAGIAIPDRFILINDVLWASYAELFTGPDNGPLWEWLFSDTWGRFDNTHTGAAKRIRHALTHGVPEDFGSPNDEWVEFYS